MFFRCLLSFSNLFLYVLTEAENFQDSLDAGTSTSARKMGVNFAGRWCHCS